MLFVMYVKYYGGYFESFFQDRDDAVAAFHKEKTNDFGAKKRIQLFRLYTSWREGRYPVFKPTERYDGLTGTWHKTKYYKELGQDIAERIVKKEVAAFVEAIKENN